MTLEEIRALYQDRRYKPGDIGLEIKLSELELLERIAVALEMLRHEVKK